jgi:hypothetical protein
MELISQPRDRGSPSGGDLLGQIPGKVPEEAGKDT